jgi:hypothetical protein
MKRWSEKWASRFHSDHVGMLLVDDLYHVFNALAETCAVPTSRISDRVFYR